MLIKGTSQAVPQGDEREWVAGTGWQTIKVWEGPKAAIEAHAQTISLDTQAGYTRIQVTSADNVHYRVRAYIGGFDGGTPGDEDIVDVWELIPQSAQLDIFNHPTVRAISDADIGRIKEYMQDPTLRQSSSPALTGGANSVALWDLVKNDQLSYLEDYFALRHTQTLVNYTQVNVSMANLEKLHTRQQLPATITPSIAAAIANIPDPSPIPTGFVFRWLKKKPGIVASISARPQVSEEWWLALWPTLIYGNAT